MQWVTPPHRAPCADPPDQVEGKGCASQNLVPIPSSARATGTVSYGRRPAGAPASQEKAPAPHRGKQNPSHPAGHAEVKRRGRLFAHCLIERASDGEVDDHVIAAIPAHTQTN